MQDDFTPTPNIGSAFRSGVGAGNRYKDSETLSALSQLNATERRHAHSARSEFLAQRFAERQDVSLGRIIHRHPRARQEAGKRTEIEDTATVPGQAVGKPQR